MNNTQLSAAFNKFVSDSKRILSINCRINGKVFSCFDSAQHEEALTLHTELFVKLRIYSVNV